MSDSIRVNTSTEKSYNLWFGNDLRTEVKAFCDRYHSAKAFVLVDAFVNAHHRTYFEENLRDYFRELHIFEVSRGEKAKSFSIYQKAIDFVLKNGVERSTPLFAIGGGVTGDLSGFVAASVLRGIPLIHIPTTLLAMVDSSIGGKTGINHETGKNLVGSFYQPDAVFADVKYLETLPRSERVNGLSEVLKYGFIHSPDILQKVKNLLDNNLFEDGDAWLPLIQKSAQIKADIVAEDVLESGKRAFLNFGHTFAHVIEREGHYSAFSHGEAVYAGMIAAIHASNYLGAHIDASNLLEFKSLYTFTLDQIKSTPADLVDGMKNDKKVKDGQIRLILLHEEGKPYQHEVEETGFVEEAWRHTLSLFS